ncbi:MAG: hypothetical protein SCARUB_00051 [Candidatus Scalindua rubra]|uniref:MPN domain-containing protein n=1 Tax=Candidatus Scalindua rubra TaxID=1872076 RepID=A0A1E3XGP2_9BACT|nr:MAG: hypothetical protein SCARUB_00051 [Candidatus Scalindua rubra]
MIYINQSLINKMLKEAKTAYPFECCGILVGSNGSEKEVCEIYPVENKNKVRAEDRYEIDSKTFDKIDREATKKKLKIIGLYHSHPDHPAAPSAFDKECACVWTEYSYIIISVRNGKEEELKSWCFDSEKQTLEEEKLKINRRKFIIGVSLIAFSFIFYFCIPLIFFLPLSLKVKAGSASISYFFSWGLTGIGIYFACKEGYEYLKQVVLKGFF